MKYQGSDFGLKVFAVILIIAVAGPPLITKCATQNVRITMGVQQ